MKKKGHCSTGWPFILINLIFKDAHGKQHNLEAPLPKDMKALLQQLKKNQGLTRSALNN